MKKFNFAWLIVLAGLLCGGCSKSKDSPDSNSDYFFRFKVDGEEIDYKSGPNQNNLTGFMSYDGNTQKYMLNIGGFKDIYQSGKNTISILLSDSDELKANTNYSNIPAAGDAYPDFIFTFGYYDNNGNLYVAGGQGNNPIYAELYRPAFVKITEMGDKHFSGNFSGTLIWYNSSQGVNELIDSVVITEGKFKVPRVRL